MDLHIKCPDCNRRLNPLVDCMMFATMVHNRTCPKCRIYWQIIVRPVRLGRRQVIHVLEWTEAPQTLRVINGGKEG